LIKQNQLNEYHLSAKLYDWCLCPKEQLSGLLSREKSNIPVITVLPMDTLEAAHLAHTKYGYQGEQIAWLNFANAHNIGGAYNRGMGTQEENTITECTTVGTLTIFAEPVPIDDAIKKWILSGKNPIPIRYRDHHHIPPGGTVICKTKIFTKDPPFDCYSIASASADFREREEFRPYTEAGEFKIKSPEYDKRIFLDMEAVLLTAIKHDIKVIILGATGI